MKNTSLNISIRIIAVFTVAMALSFVPEYYPSFFGDWHCNGGIKIYKSDHLGNYFNSFKGCRYTEDSHISTWHWGYRHWLYLFMGICLAVVQIVNIFIIIDNKPKN